MRQGTTAVEPQGGIGSSSWCMPMAIIQHLKSWPLCCMALLSLSKSFQNAGTRGCRLAATIQHLNSWSLCRIALLFLSKGLHECRHQRVQLVTTTQHLNSWSLGPTALSLSKGLHECRHQRVHIGDHNSATQFLVTGPHCPASEQGFA